MPSFFPHLQLPSTAISSSVYSFHHLSRPRRPLKGHEGLLVAVQLPSCVWLCHPMGWSMLGLPVPHCLPKFAQVHVHCISDVIQSSHLLTPPSPLPSISPSIRDFPDESAVHFRWPSYWSFSFSISPSSEYSGLISLKIDWLDLLAIQAKNWENVKERAWTSLQDLLLGIHQKIRAGSFFFFF